MLSDSCSHQSPFKPAWQQLLSKTPAAADQDGGMVEEKERKEDEVRQKDGQKEDRPQPNLTVNQDIEKNLLDLDEKPGSCPQLERPDRANRLTLPKMGTRWCSHMENMSMSLTITISSWSSSKMASFSTSVETQAAAGNTVSAAWLMETSTCSSRPPPGGPAGLLEDGSPPLQKASSVEHVTQQTKEEEPRLKPPGWLAC